MLIQARYHTEFYQILSIDVVWIPKKQNVSSKCTNASPPPRLLREGAKVIEKGEIDFEKLPKIIKNCKFDDITFEIPSASKNSYFCQT